MYVLYQNKYSNYLNLNLIKVKYANDRTILDNDFAIRLSDDYISQANDLIVFKLHLFLGVLVCQNHLKDEIVIIDANTFENGLKIGKKKVYSKCFRIFKTH